MTASGNDPFQKVKDLQQKRKILQGLVTDKTQVFLSVALTKKGYWIDCLMFIRDLMTIQAPPDLVSSLKHEDEVFFEFGLADEKYICKTSVQLDQGQIKIDLSVDLYKLQRRDDFRLRLPVSYNAHFILQGRQYKVLDISAGGCRIRAETPPDAKVGSTLAGTLVLEDREPLQIVAAEVVHIDSDHTVGLHFKKMADSDHHALHALVIAIYRELFASLKNR
jgi:hypothetical protein